MSKDTRRTYEEAIFRGTDHQGGSSNGRWADCQGAQPRAWRKPANPLPLEKKKFSGMDVDEARRLKALEQENSRLKRIVADLTLDVTMLKDVNSKKW